MGRLSFSVQMRVTKQLVIRESDGRTLLLVAGYIGSGNVQPAFVAVIEPDSD